MNESIEGEREESVAVAVLDVAEGREADMEDELSRDHLLPGIKLLQLQLNYSN